MGAIEKVPQQFRVPDRVPYPDTNFPDAELWFAQKLTETEVPDGIVWLPILWTAYHKANNFGNDPWAIKFLQFYIDSLDKTKKYATLVQYDDGLLIDVSGLNIKVFAMAGGICDFRVPLIANSNPRIFRQKDIHCSFIGRKTHPIRESAFNLKPKFTSYISEARHNPDQYREILARSVFSLCYRGYSPTSFRIQESIEQGAIPVYISNEHFLPYGIPFDYGVLVDEKDASCIPEILAEISPEEIKRKQEMLPTVYSSMYTFGTMKRIILNQLSAWSQ